MLLNLARLKKFDQHEYCSDISLEAGGIDVSQLFQGR